MKKLKSTYDLAVEGMPERIRLAREIRGLFKPVDCYHPKYHKFRPAPVEQIKCAFALTGDAKPYRLHRNLYSRLYDALQKSSVEQAYIEAMWGDPYLHTITHWATIPQERRESLQKEYPEMQDLAEEVEEDRRDFLDKFDKFDKFDNFNDTPAGQFLNNMGFALGAVAAVHPAGGVARIGVTVAAGLPKVVEAITALGALEIAREFSILCNKKSGGEPKSTGEAKPRLGTSGYKGGQKWTDLKPVNTPETTRQIGKINKQAFGGGEVRTDGEYVFRFDPAHKTAKVHMERYKKIRNGVWQGYGEIDPKTGSVLEGSIDATKKRIIKW